jgi:hypothetical protein
MKPRPEYRGYIESRDKRGVSTQTVTPADSRYRFAVFVKRAGRSSPGWGC